MQYFIIVSPRARVCVCVLHTSTWVYLPYFLAYTYQLPFYHMVLKIKLRPSGLVSRDLLEYLLFTCLFIYLDF